MRLNANFKCFGAPYAKCQYTECANGFVHILAAHLHYFHRKLFSHRVVERWWARVLCLLCSASKRKLLRAYVGVEQCACLFVPIVVSSNTIALLCVHDSRLQTAISFRFCWHSSSYSLWFIFGALVHFYAANGDPSEYVIHSRSISIIVNAISRSPISFDRLKICGSLICKRIGTLFPTRNFRRTTTQNVAKFGDRESFATERAVCRGWAGEGKKKRENQFLQMGMQSNPSSRRTISLSLSLDPFYRAFGDSKNCECICQMCALAEGRQWIAFTEYTESMHASQQCGNIVWPFSQSSIDVVVALLCVCASVWLANRQ